MNKRILFVGQNITYDGYSKMFNWTVNSLSEYAENNVYLYTFYYSDTCYDFSEKVKWEEVIREKSERWKIIFDLRRKIKKICPDIIVAFLYDAGLYSIFASVNTKTPVIVCERSDPYANLPLNAKVSQNNYRWADGAVFQLPEAKEYFKNIIKRQTAIIPNPIFDTGYMVTLPFSQRKNEISYVGRINNKQKRIDILLMAFAVFHKKHQEICLSLYGDGKDMEASKQLVQSLGISDKVIFKGKVDKPAQYIASSKCFVMSSDYEGLSNALLEAMSLGLPVVTTDTSPGGARFLIEDGKNGLISDRGNVVMLAEKLMFLFDNPQIADNMGREARKVLDRFKPTNIKEMWNDYLNFVCMTFKQKTHN